MDELIFAGNKYISSKRASKLTGYTTDYIGQMCRGDKIDCRLVGRNWYINERVLDEQKKNFKKEQAGRIEEIKYKKLDLEPMYYSSDERSNNPEISKIYEEASDEDEEKIPVHIIKKPEISIERHGQSHIVPNTERQIMVRQNIVPQRTNKRLPMITTALASIILLAGVLFIAGTLMLEQEIHYSSSDKNDIDTSFQLANILKSLDF